MSENLPSFSVIVPTYERPRQLASCLEALARLDYPPEKFEVIVVDDGSAISVENVVKQFSGSIDVKLLAQENAGPAAARNFGATCARGKFIAFTDDDCAPHPGWLRAFAQHFAVTPDRVIGGQTVNALRSNPYSETSQLIIDVVYAHFNVTPDEATFFASNNIAVPAARFRELQGFDESFITSEDRDFCDRWRARGFGMSFAADAIVVHAHHLTLRTLWQQHFAYGQGAYRFHSECERRGRKTFRPDLVFYRKLLAAPFSQIRNATKIASGLRLLLLLLWSQIANAAGFAYESYRPNQAAAKEPAHSVSAAGSMPIN